MKSVVDIVRKQLQDSNISEQIVSKLVDHKIDEIDKHITDRQKSVKKCYHIQNGGTKHKERQAKDLETLSEMIG